MKNSDNKGCKKSNFNPVNINYVGVMGPRGKSDTITIRNTVTGDPGESAKVTDNGSDGNHILDFVVPRGFDGTSFTILGKYDDVTQLEQEHPDGNIGEAYMVNGDLYIWADNTNTWENMGKVQGPKGDTGEKGEKGDKGEDGYTLSKASYIVTFNDDDTGNGVSVLSNNRLPLERLELNIDNMVTLDSDNNTIKFNEIGYYKVSFTVSAYPLVNGLDFDPTTDIVAIGFKATSTDNVYIGTSQFVYNGEAVELYGQGVISVMDSDTLYELCNLSKSTIFLDTPDIMNISSNSYFSNPLITMVIVYLGK